jgi:hypothetical protein
MGERRLTVYYGILTPTFILISDFHVRNILFTIVFVFIFNLIFIIIY